MRALGIDTSNYTTSAAVFDGSGGYNAGRLLEVRPGELGCGRATRCSSTSNTCLGALPSCGRKAG